MVGTDSPTAGGRIQIESMLSTVTIKIHCSDELAADALMDQIASQYLDTGRIVLQGAHRG